MITIRLAGLDWSRIRFGISPVWETVAAVRAALAPRLRHSPAWLDRSLRRLAVLDLPLLRELVDPGRPYLVDFLAPPPERADSGFAAELERIRSTPRALVRKELRRAGIEIAAVEVPARLAGVVAELRAAWDGAVRHEWPVVRALLERDVTWRARQLAREGGAAMLAGLHPAVAAGGAALRIEAAHTAERLPGRRGLLLVPSAYAWPMVYVVDAPPWRATIAYPARGVSAPGETAPTREAIAALVGAGRSEVLLAVRDGATTQQLALTLHLSPGAVSQHLNRLRLAGMVQSTRMGRVVLHELTRRGEVVVAAFGRTPDD